MLNRPRRNRRTGAIRDMVRETVVTANDLIYPMFVVDGTGVKDEVKSLPGNYRWSLDLLLPEIGECVALGIKSFVLFPAVDESLKDSEATYSYAKENFYLNIAREIKKAYPEVCLMSDVALDPYSSDGHDGIVKEGEILNDETLPVLGKMAVAQAEAGFDIIGPSDMMDGRIQFIRESLDAAGYHDVAIMSYAAKYASSYYGPFRDALDSAPKDGDKKTYQMDYANKKEAIREAELDEMEGADYLMVKPALSYLDIIHVLNENFNLPISAYNVSGEYAMLHAAAEKGWADLEAGMIEQLYSIKRAGASIILTYFAKEYAKYLKR